MITQLSLPTALGPNDPDDGDTGRRQRGMAIAALVPVSKDKIGYRVPSQSSKGSYIVTLNGKDGKDGCSCPDYEERQRYCKHLYAVKYIIQREELADGDVAETRAVRVTYGRNWSAYNSAQSHEGEHFVTLLRALCDTVPQPPQRGPGRPRLPISDMLFAVMVKVYSTMSTRRVMSDLRVAHADGTLNRLPSFASLFRFLGSVVILTVIPAKAGIQRPLAANAYLTATGFWIPAFAGKTETEAWRPIFLN